jgi:hypothetical protein
MFDEDVVLDLLGVYAASFLVVNQRFGKACWSHFQGINNPTVDGRCMKGWGCSLIGSGKSM